MHNSTACHRNVTRQTVDGRYCYCHSDCRGSECCADYATVCLGPHDPVACIDYYCTPTPTDSMIICSTESPFTQYASLCHALCYDQNLTAVGRCPSTTTTATTTTGTTSTSTSTVNMTPPLIDTSGENPPPSKLDWWIWLLIAIGVLFLSVASAALVLYCTLNKGPHSGRISPETARRRIVVAYDNAVYEGTTTVTSLALHDNPMYESADGPRTVNNPVYSSNTSSPHYVNTSDEDE